MCLFARFVWDFALQLSGRTASKENDPKLPREVPTYPTLDLVGMCCSYLFIRCSEGWQRCCDSVVELNSCSQGHPCVPCRRDRRNGQWRREKFGASIVVRLEGCKLLEWYARHFIALFTQQGLPLFNCAALQQPFGKAMDRQEHGSAHDYDLLAWKRLKTLAL